MHLNAPNIFRAKAKQGCDLFGEMIVDNFAGGGGASMGIEAACGRSVDIAINHDQHSVSMHQMNHPHTRHLCEDVWDVNPLEATAGRRVGLAWFSPDCRHFSRAKGGKPVEKKIRGLAWIVVKWAKAVRPRVIILENVREFQDWSPLVQKLDASGFPSVGKDGKPEMMPCLKRKGQTFRRWRTQLENLGYVTDCRVLNAADFGAPTHRRRFFLVARCDGRPVAWPEPTHGPGRRPYRTAAECIDWSLPCPSIFLTKAEAKSLRVIRPLAEKTMRRIAMGLKRYVLDNPKPFIVTCNHGGPEFRGQGVDEPFKTVTAARDAHGVVSPHLTKFRGNSVGSPLQDPMPTITSGAGSIRPAGAAHAMGLIAPCIVRTDHHQSHATNAFDPQSPIGTITSANGHAVVSPYLVEVQNSSNEAGHRAIDRPAHTVTANPKGGGMAVVGPCLSRTSDVPGGECPHCGHDGWLNNDGSCRHCLRIIATYLSANYGEAPHQETRGQSAEEPIRTVTPANNTGVLVTANITQYFGGSPTSRGKSPDEPLPTITAEDHNGLVAATITKYHGQKGDESCAKSPTEPLPTADTSNRFGLVSTFLAKHYGGVVGHVPGRPLGTITAVDHHSVVAAHMLKNNHGSHGVAAEEPLHTITTGDRHGVVASHLSKFYGTNTGSDLQNPAPTVTANGWHLAEVRAFLMRYYSSGGQVGPVDAPAPTVTTKDRLGVVTVEGADYLITDIGLRMLAPRELLRAQFGKYAKDYILTGTKSQQVAKIGNSVPPELAEAMVRANYADIQEAVA